MHKGLDRSVSLQWELVLRVAQSVGWTHRELLDFLAGQMAKLLLTEEDALWWVLETLDRKVSLEANGKHSVTTSIVKQGLDGNKEILTAQKVRSREKRRIEHSPKLPPQDMTVIN